MVDPTRNSRVEIEVADDAGNVSVLDFEMVYAPGLYRETVLAPIGAEVLDAARPFEKNSGDIRVSIPARTLYESVLYSQYELLQPPAIVKSQSGSVLSPFYAVHSEDVPVHSAFTLSIKADVPEELRSRVVLARATGNGAEKWLAVTAAKYDNGFVTGKAGNFGVWCVAADTKAPVIKPLFQSGADLSGARSINFSISDDLSGVASYRAEIDGRWVILEHNAMKGTLIHHFDDALTGRNRTHEITLTLTDGTGNKEIYTGKYFR